MKNSEIKLIFEQINKDLDINDKIYKLKGVIYKEPSRTTIEIGKNKHIDDEYGIFMNHSF